MIVDNDHAFDPDGLVALAHQLLAEPTEVRAITCTSIPSGIPGEETRVGRAQALADELADRLGPEIRPPTLPDTVQTLGELTGMPPSAGAIVAEALRDDDRPLFVTCGGPLTNVAAALTAEPRIADRMTVVWIGGNARPAGGWEYNLTVDLPAAQYVFNESRVPLWQFPQPVYRQCLYSVAEMEWDLTSIGPFGEWLYQQFTSPPDFVQIGGTWPMGDSPLVLATALGSESSTYRTIPSPRIEDDLTYGPHPQPREHRMYESVDFRLIIGDFLARLRLAERACRSAR